MKVQPLGDQAVLIHCDTEVAAGRLASAARAVQPLWLRDVVLAYSSVAIYFDPAKTRYSDVAQWLSNATTDTMTTGNHRLVNIPCCYELGLDLERVAAIKKISTTDVIRWHTSQMYTVYAVGFCPGFPYMGYLPDVLAGVPRLDSPRLRVEPGSVGLTGRQTGIYPLVRPGGWNLIGRTPLQLVDLENDYFALMPGDRVQFVPINQTEYQRRLGERL
jgi:inhibitor of KinA